MQHYQQYLTFGNESFGLNVAQLDRVGLFTQGECVCGAEGEGEGEGGMLCWPIEACCPLKTQDAATYRCLLPPR